MGFTNPQPNDSATIPISSEYSPQNNTFPAMQGADGAYVDQFGNASTAPVMSFIQPRVVQRAVAVTGSGAKTLSCSFQNPVMGGNSIVVCVGVGDQEDAFTVFKVTDTQGNLYTKVGASTQGTLLESAIYFASGIKSGLGSNPSLLPVTNPVLNTITFNITGPTAVPTGISIKIYEIWGLIASIDAIDQIDAGNSINPSTAASTFASLTPSVPNTIAFTAVATGKITTITPGANWSTNDGTIFPWGGNLGAFDSQYRQLSTVGTIIPQAALSIATPWVMSAASFRTLVLPIQGSVNIIPCQNANIISIASSVSSILLLNYDASRKGLSILNESTSTLYIAFAVTGTHTSYTVQIPGGQQLPNGQMQYSYYEMPLPIYTGPISGFWSSVNGNARITSLYSV